LKVIISLFCLAASATVWSNAAAVNAGPIGALDFGGVQFKVLSPDGKQMIGSTRFTVVRNNSTEEIKGETSYLDGEHDNEDEQLFLGDAHSAPRLDTYRHSFFNADGTLHMERRARREIRRRLMHELFVGRDEGA
jgi:hypothetical protein